MALQQTSTTNSLVTQNRRRMRNHALTQAEFLGVLGDLSGLENLPNLNPEVQPNHWGRPEDFSRQPPTERFSRPRITHFPTALFFHRSRGVCACCCCSSGVAASPYYQSPLVATNLPHQGPSASPSLPQLGPSSSLPQHPLPEHNDRLANKHVRFASDTKPGVLVDARDDNNTERQDTVHKAIRTRHPSPYRYAREKTKTKRQQGRTTAKRRASWEELVSSFKKDQLKDPVRRRRHNLALSGDDFEQSIFPGLLSRGNWIDFVST